MEHLSQEQTTASCSLIDEKFATIFPKLRHVEVVRLTFKLLTAILLGLTSLRAQAAHTHARLFLSAEAAKPGDTVMAAIQLRMDSGWHTYWKNAGDSGMPTTIDWELPAGITPGEIQWPIPEKLSEANLTTYIFKTEVMLLVPLKVGADLSAGNIEVKAKVSWLECDIQCVPGKADVRSSLAIGTQTKASSDASVLEAWQKRNPQEATDLAARAFWEKGGTSEARPLIIEWSTPKPVTEADFLPYSGKDFDIDGQTEKLPSELGKARLRKQVKKLEGDWPHEIAGVLVQKDDKERSAYEVKLPLESPAAPAVSSAETPAPSLSRMLLYAFIGGLILNVMPCVLPVIALKILGFVSQAKDEPRRARKLALVYALGVLVSFLVLASLVIGVKAAGHSAGWGLQFGNPYFLITMTTLVTLIALNLFGVFEVTLGGRTMDAAAGLSSKHGAAGAFFNGLLATVLATSCTAPFLGAAIGFAFTQPFAVVLLIFCVIAIGLAAPYVILTWQPAWLKFLPKPGAWMERFKVGMGFPMLAAAVWLFNLASVHYGERSWWLAIFLVMVAVAAWLYGEFLQRHRARPGLAVAAIIVVLGAAYIFVLDGNLRWREPLSESAATSGAQHKPKGIAWEPWSLAAVEQARAEGRVILVDFTARWCATCNVWVKPALESASVRDKIHQVRALALLGDYSRFPPEMTKELNRHGRAGVPLVLVYPKKSSEPPIVLSETPTPGMIAAALDRAASS
jgi:thiol:disulfide interchange protein DsbD